MQSPWSSFLSDQSPQTTAPAASSDNPWSSYILPAPQTSNSGVDFNFVATGLEQRGVPSYIAQALAVNAGDESNFNPGVNEKNPIVAGSRGGFGLMQWTGPRRRALEAYAAERGLPASDPNLQLDFTVHELNTTENRAYQRMSAAGDANQAAVAVVNDYLRPAEVHRRRRSQKYATFDFPATSYQDTGSTPTRDSSNPWKDFIGSSVNG